MVQREEFTPNSAQKVLDKEEKFELDEGPIVDTVANPPSSPEVKKQQPQPPISPEVEKRPETERPLTESPPQAEQPSSQAKHTMKPQPTPPECKFKDQPKFNSTGQVQIQVQLTWKDVVVVPKDQLHLPPGINYATCEDQIGESAEGKDGEAKGKEAKTEGKTGGTKEGKTEGTKEGKTEETKEGKTEGKTEGKKEQKQKVILNHVSGTVKPQQFLAIIGASGRGI